MSYPMPSPNPRKRPAPGAPPVVSIPQMQQQFPSAQPEQVFTWNGGVDGNNFVDPSPTNIHSFGIVSPQNQFGQGIQTPSTALARRGMNRALVPTGAHQTFDTNPEPWVDFDDPNMLPLGDGMDENDYIEVLEEKAVQAKRDAQAKRKQIPPFVQKLSSFLDESKNTDLIRWSDKGDSFIVLDEDEFAKTLIPELFKHNNYASFVRQLNMYGFHKRVGLSDNSMKASERKNKSPSEYYNPYFKRGHPNLLWLINKPKGGSSKKKGKKEDGDAESEEEVGVDETVGQAFSNAAAAVGRNAGEVGTLQKRDLVAVKSQIDQLQQQQKTISQLIDRLRRDHNQLYQQALAFQSMHERHENSINAILNFLANVFRKSLEDQGGAQSVSELLSSIIPGTQGQMPQGSVVDLGDFINQRTTPSSTMSPPKRQPRLLPPIPGQGKASTVSPSPSTSSTNQTPYGQMGSVTELFDASPSDTTSPNYLKQELQTNPQEGMMRIINDTNANKTSGIDLPTMAAQTPVSMSNDQRTKMLNIMAGQTSAPSPSIPSPAGGPTSNASSTSIAPVATAGSLSPLGSPMPPPPSLYDIHNTHTELEHLQRMQTEQAAKLGELSSLLGPLSPSGRIPGLDDNGYFDASATDLDQFLDPSAFNDLGGYTGADFGSTTDGNDFNFGLDGAGVGGIGLSGAGGGGSDDAGSGDDSPSPAVTEEITRNDLDSPERDAKRRRRA